MSFSLFFFRSLVGAALSVVILVGINLWIDLYGLYWRTGKGISIYSDERTSKYLLAHRYIPENFDGYILGPSLSANLNPKEIVALNIYNLSMLGANITEQKAVVDKAISIKPPKFVIICLHPYLTVDHGMKTDMINQQQYYGALGSVRLYKSYFLKIVRGYNLMPNKYPKNQFNEYGYNDYDDLLATMPVEDKIREQMQRNDAINASIDSTALLEFRSLIEELTSKKVNIIAYFHPIPYPIREKFSNPLIDYKSKMVKELNNKAKILDFNSLKYDFFTKDFTNYIDHGHLSKKGQQFLLNEIIKESRINHSAY
jgi:hypothetical protein